MNIHKAVFALGAIALVYGIWSESNEMLFAVKVRDALRGIVCLGLSVACWKVSEYFDGKSGVIQWCLLMLVFYLFSISSFFFQSVSGLVVVIVWGYIIFAVAIAANGGSWDRRGPGDGGE